MTATETWPLSLLQQGHLAYEARYGRRPCNVYSAHRLGGPVPPAALATALREASARHPLLRCRLVGGHGDPVMAIGDEPGVPLTVVRDVPGSELPGLLEDHGRTVFDRSAAPPWSCLLVHTTEGAQVLSLSLDHLISDGMSRDALLGALSGAPGRARPYRDFVDWQAARFGPGHGEGLDYWREHLRGIPVNRAVPLPFCRDPRAPLSGDTRVESVVLDGGLPAGVTRMAAEHRVTPFTVLLAALAALLARVSGEPDVSVQVPMGARPPGFEGTIGWFANDVVVRLREAGGPRFGDVLRHARDTWLGALEHQFTPYYLVFDEVERERRVDDHRPPMVVFNGRNAHRDVKALGTTLALESLIGLSDEVGLTVFAVRHADRLVVHGIFDPARFDAGGVAGFLGELRGLVGEVTR